MDINPAECRWTGEPQELPEYWIDPAREIQEYEHRDHAVKLGFVLDKMNWELVGVWIRARKQPDKPNLLLASMCLVNIKDTDEISLDRDLDRIQGFLMAVAQEHFVDKRIDDVQAGDDNRRRVNLKVSVLRRWFQKAGS